MGLYRVAFNPEHAANGEWAYEERPRTRAEAVDKMALLAECYAGDLSSLDLYEVIAWGGMFLSGVAAPAGHLRGGFTQVLTSRPGPGGGFPKWRAVRRVGWGNGDIAAAPPLRSAISLPKNLSDKVAALGAEGPSVFTVELADGRRIEDVVLGPGGEISYRIPQSSGVKDDFTLTGLDFSSQHVTALVHSERTGFLFWKKTRHHRIS